MPKRIVLSLLPLPLLLSGCNFAPTYRQPPVSTPDTLVSAAAETRLPGGALAIDLGWRDFFRDERLQALIAAALENNRDLAQSMARVAQARAQYRISKAERLPALTASSDATRSRQPASILGGETATGGASGVTTSQFDVGLGVSAFELDLWGRVRNLAEAQRNAYLATAEGARAYRLSLIAEVASTYYAIYAGEERIALAQRTLEGRREGRRIAKLRLDAGVTSSVDYDQSVLLLTQAETELADLHRTTDQSRNLLDVLVGGSVARALPPANAFQPDQQVHPLDAGLPSALLAARPDIAQAEYQLRAANADIGAARAQFFPTLSLTGLSGFASNSLTSLFDGDNHNWSFGGSASLPIFDWGQRKAQLDVSKARAEELTAAYQKTVQTAFREVADALVARRRLAEQITAQDRTIEAQRRLARTARLRYDNGISIYLQVLDAERNLFAAEQQSLQLRATDLQNSVSLYVALGGGLHERKE